MMLKGARIVGGQLAPQPLKLTELDGYSWKRLLTGKKDFWSKGYTPED